MVKYLSLCDHFKNRKNILPSKPLYASLSCFFPAIILFLKIPSSIPEKEVWKSNYLTSVKDVENLNLLIQSKEKFYS